MKMNYYFGRELCNDRVPPLLQVGVHGVSVHQLQVTDTNSNNTNQFHSISSLACCSYKDG